VTNVPPDERTALVAEVLQAYEANLGTVRLFRDQLYMALTSSDELAKHVHSMKTRLKDPEHLEDKLLRKMKECDDNEEAFSVTSENLLTRITDLAGVRILHLYTRQIRDIDRALRDIFEEQKYELLEGPFARTWDDESREYFQSCGIDTQVSPTMYTSVHYVIGSASRTAVTCEIQVRTLSEELWGRLTTSSITRRRRASLRRASRLRSWRGLPQAPRALWTPSS
jgi:ppGpp synthetase/RelA/SpoT-type nucleotidyltranferase